MDYRLYCYDGADKLWVADGIQAESVDEAIEVALGLGNVFKCEIWQGGRMVAKIEAGTATLMEPPREMRA